INEDMSMSTNKRLQFQGKVSYKIIDGLLVNGNFNYENQNYTYKEYLSKQSETWLENGKATREQTEAVKKLMELYANYDKTFGNVHKLSLMAGYSWEENKTGDGFKAYTYDFYNDDLGWNDVGIGNFKKDDSVEGKTYEKLRMISYYARANYSFDSRYIIQAAIRRDGSSAFGANNRWATFPSAAVAWRLGQEKFMEGIDFMDDLKLRVGYGESGNSTGFGAYKAQYYYTCTGWFPYTDGNNYRTLGVDHNANPDLKWETTKMWNIGLDFSFFNTRLNGTLEFYNKRTDDMIYDYKVSTNRYPVDVMTANVGQMQNTGVELTINAVPVQSRDFTWTTSLNLSHNKNEVKSLSNQTYSVSYIDLWNPDLRGLSQGSEIVRLMEGQPIGTFYTWEWAGYNENGVSQYYTHDEETGERDGGVTTDPTLKDKTIIGNAQPKLQMGWNNTLTYKNWTLNAFFQGVFGQKVFNEIRAAYSTVGDILYGKNLLAEVATEQNYNDYNSHRPSDRYLEDGSYFRLSSLTLGYTFKNFNGWLNNVHVYATCNNVFTLTSYSGRDPELCLGGLTPGIDARKDKYPRTRQFLFGVNVNF
ncbi:MAG: SusC/RagA family TonB-linked outer membrane protein, partial [Muribaculaceae bacterium]|nr:SusC/RagA family TonB-linked outer membrane protein [Muribaculaceae bacterium]